VTSEEPERRRSVLTGVKYVTLFVSDQDRALDFYTNVLGFEKRVDNPSPGGERFLGVALEGQELLVILWPGTPGKATGSGPKPGSCVIGTTDCRTDFERLRVAGVQFEEAEPIESPYGVNVTAIDPDGNRLLLNQRPVAAATGPATTRAESDGVRLASIPERGRSQYDASQGSPVIRS
jgi:catechol 2,3-dioxygenase-like lactoylglutathione lyase family enzyme